MPSKTSFIVLLLLLLSALSVHVSCQPRCNWIGIKVADGETFHVGDYAITPTIIRKLGQFLISIEKNGFLYAQLQYFPNPYPIRMTSVRERGNYSHIIFYVLFDRDRSSTEYAYIEIRDSEIFPPYALLTLEPLGLNISHAREKNIEGRQEDVVKVWIRNLGGADTNVSIKVLYEAKEGDFEGNFTPVAINLSYPKQLFIKAKKGALLPITIKVNRTKWCVAIKITVIANYTSPWLTDDQVTFRYSDGENMTASTSFYVNFFEKQRIETPSWEGRPIPSALPAFICSEKGTGALLITLALFIGGIILRKRG